MTTYALYYIETNLICIVFMLYIFSIYWKDKGGETEAVSFRIIIIEIIIYCIVDVVAALFKTSDSMFARPILYIANSIYVPLPMLMVTSWNQYINTRMAQNGMRPKKAEKILRYTMYISFALYLTTPFTGIGFTLDENNMYQRTVGTYIAPAIEMIFLFYTTARLFLLKKHVTEKSQLNLINCLIYFAFPPVIASILQMAFYGSTVCQVGFSMSIFIVFVYNQKYQISKDELTGINNRTELDKYKYNIVKGTDNVLLFLIDIDGLKHINDTFGHAEGDVALKKAAKILSNTCQRVEKNIFVARLGGDEFIIILKESQPEMDRTVRDIIDEETELVNAEDSMEYKVTLSVGSSFGNIYSENDFDKLSDLADKRMYEFKKKFRKQTMRS